MNPKWKIIISTWFPDLKERKQLHHYAFIEAGNITILFSVWYSLILTCNEFRKPDLLNPNHRYCSLKGIIRFVIIIVMAFLLIGIAKVISGDNVYMNFFFATKLGASLFFISLFSLVPYFFNCCNLVSD
jgi:hypothetical protein